MAQKKTKKKAAKKTMGKKKMKKLRGGIMADGTDTLTAEKKLLLTTK